MREYLHIGIDLICIVLEYADWDLPVRSVLHQVCQESKASPTARRDVLIGRVRMRFVACNKLMDDSVS